MNTHPDPLSALSIPSDPATDDGLNRFADDLRQAEALHTKLLAISGDLGRFAGICAQGGLDLTRLRAEREKLRIELALKSRALAEQALELETAEIALAAAQEGLLRRTEQMELAATTDELTSLFNRRHLLALGQQEWLRFQRYGSSLGIMVLDLDHLKTVNDSYGQQAGDQILQYFAGILRANLRDADVAGRYGGDEFLVLMPYAEAEGMEQVAERIRTGVKTWPTLWMGRPTALTLSVGYTLAIPTDTTFEEVVQRADRCLLRAKQEGCNRVVGASP
jgi:diguanylate cyclase (GGDEF)-like protein